MTTLITSVKFQPRKLHRFRVTLLDRQSLTSVQLQTCQQTLNNFKPEEHYQLTITFFNLFYF